MSISAAAGRTSVFAGCRYCKSAINETPVADTPGSVPAPIAGESASGRRSNPARSMNEGESVRMLLLSIAFAWVTVVPVPTKRLFCKSTGVDTLLPTKTNVPRDESSLINVLLTT